VQLWWLVQATLFHGSPQFAYGFRRWLLRCFGAKVGRGVVIRPSVTITYPWKVSIGDHAWVGDDVVLYSVRAFGAVDFALNQADAQISYIPAANQQGSFLNKNRWQFNALHMGAPAFAPNPARDVLLVGDSVVYGGNPYAEPDRLGPRLAAALQGSGGASLADFGGQLGAAQ